MRTILVCGGRDFGVDLQERNHLFKTLDELHAQEPIRLLVHGAAKGADKAAARWAEVRNVPAQAYPADWEDIDHPDAVVREHPNGNKYDAAAGRRRNATMLSEHPEIDLVVAFRGGPGTAHMVSLAKRLGKVVLHA